MVEHLRGRVEVLLRLMLLLRRHNVVRSVRGWLMQTRGRDVGVRVHNLSVGGGRCLQLMSLLLSLMMMLIWLLRRRRRRRQLAHNTALMRLLPAVMMMMLLL